MSGMNEAQDGPLIRGPKCPTCRAPVVWHGNPHRPFCSLTCRLIDLGGWLDERYRIEQQGETENVS